MNNFKILECKVYQTKLVDGATHYEIDRDFLDYVTNNYNGEKIQVTFEQQDEEFKFSQSVFREH